MITGYTVLATSGEVVKSVDVGVDDGREATVSGLNPNTQYSVRVAAVNSDGTGPATSIDIETPGEYMWFTVYERKCFSPHQMDSLLHLLHHPLTL